MSPKLSIIIPVCNVENYLADCLDSALRQSFQDVEIICINDGSTDGSLEILHKYEKQDSRVKVIDKPNAGYGAAMNDGLDAATGTYVGILEPTIMSASMLGKSYMQWPPRAIWTLSKVATFSFPRLKSRSSTQSPRLIDIAPHGFLKFPSTPFSHQRTILAVSG